MKKKTMNKDFVGCFLRVKKQQQQQQAMNQ